ncbi:MAG: hypothetical protein A3D67_02800 [Candidatus Lloydbacteria bacterium RIFCSPHIGHO2_02_FULL_51_22]|uniref:Antitoxin n=3 Tax=Candidatus Lloydiibacteriota TaxID=1817910 RepID=A0A1G2DJ08_9BACT|nr:MAG: hypothetical protein A3D67_02800 [Candidatus Lloydbacteria bacterium RIFCSPHIGHO2_02_FULL_51_22]OGZ14651.1 MAG: hypothetical protein A3J08_01000 [Candidatus Lloydbacteria bacterium RIFCSPLOWO2_02_FULL_51_11]OGZ16858.1 MAG: hypothetical protein A3G11_01720 [Candidatus Lloydbacteria bacterium RIFCSPLOWO2_12_FULL_51_9]
MRARKDQRINIRLSEADLTLLRETAEKEGIPYQSLVTSIIHRYATGQLISVADMQIVLQLRETRRKRKR